MTAPSAPLEKAVEESRKALAVYDRDMSTFGAIQCVLALRLLIAALDADLPRLVAVAEAAVEAERLSTVARNVYAAIPDESRQGQWQREAWRAAGEADDAIEKLFAAVRGEGKETT